MVLIDSVARLIPGVLGNEDSAMNESVYSGLLEHPQYTQPREYRGMEVPEVLPAATIRISICGNWNSLSRSRRSADRRCSGRSYPTGMIETKTEQGGSAKPSAA